MDLRGYKSMAVDYAKRSFLRARISKELPLRPPYNAGEQQFIEQCTRCNECVDVCETKIIEIGSGGFPRVNFADDECTFCGKCSDVCESNALDTTANQAFSTDITVTNQCLAQNEVYCQSCRDACDELAIKFDFFSERIPKPQIDLEACNSCGACVSICPPNAINITITKERFDE